ncbi:hypothetical protein H1R20_g5962, partial [Candolleomyces eurysporus]
MSVASRNPFALLDAEDSSRPASPGAAKQGAPAPPSAPAARGQQKKTRGGPASRGGKYYARGGKPAPKDGSGPGEDAPAPEGQRRFEGERGERGGRGGRGGRGRGAPRGGRGGRAFDRHSATGKTDSHKKVHQGWGGDEPNTELKQEQAASADAAAEAVPAEGGAADWGGATGGDSWGAAPAADAWGGAPEGEAATGWAAPAEGEAAAPEGKPRRREEEEEEDNTLTFDQYLAKKKDQDAAIPKLEATRQANEGAGDDIWKDAVALNKNEEEESYFIGKTKTAPKSKTKKEEKVYLEIDARFERPDRGGRGRGRGDRGDRGGDRGGERRGRGRGGPRGGRQNGPNAAPNVDDQTAFPSLA